MKINRLDAHDRLQHLTSQEMDISACCQDIINQRPFGNHPFYIFAHARTLGWDERVKLFMSGVYSSLEDVPSKTMIWQPRLTKPAAQSNSMLFKAYPGTDVLKVLWIIPDEALWGQYDKGKVTENQTVVESIYAFKTNKKKLEEKEDDDLDDKTIDSIYREIVRSKKSKDTKLVLS